MQIRRQLLAVMGLGFLAYIGAISAAAPPPESLTVDLGGARMEFVLIHPGSFLMGSKQGDADERPAHRVIIAKPFYLGKFLVTQEQWQTLMGSNPSTFPASQSPVDFVYWDECQTFLRKMGEKAPGYTFLLPTEAQWEYACRAGTTTTFFFGDEPRAAGNYGWFKANSAGSTHPVGLKKPNPWGLYDMCGNVWEWCEDWYGDYQGTNPDNLILSPTYGAGLCLRGGSWKSDASGLGSAVRHWSAPIWHHHDAGFRVVCLPAQW